MFGAALGALVAYVGATGLAAFFASNSYQPLRLELEPNWLGTAVRGGCSSPDRNRFRARACVRGAGADVATELKGNTASATGQRTGHRLGPGKWLVGMQVALSMVVLAGAGLLHRTLNKLHSIDPGFDTRNILLFSINPEQAGYSKKQISDLYANLQRASPHSQES